MSQREARRYFVSHVINLRRNRRSFRRSLMFTEFPTSRACLRHKRPRWAAASDSHAGPMQDWQRDLVSLYQFYRLQLSEPNALLDFQRANAWAWLSRLASVRILPQPAGLLPKES
jgi:hypothetical protein